MMLVMEVKDGTDGEGEVAPSCVVNTTATFGTGGAIGTGHGANTISSTADATYFSVTVVGDGCSPSSVALDAFAEEDHHGFAVVFSTSPTNTVHSVVRNTTSAT